jgi:hypothetical protein
LSATVALLGDRDPPRPSSPFLPPALLRVTVQPVAKVGAVAAWRHRWAVAAEICVDFGSVALSVGALDDPRNDDEEFFNRLGTYAKPGKPEEVARMWVVRRSMERMRAVSDHLGVERDEVGKQRGRSPRQRHLRRDPPPPWAGETDAAGVHLPAPSAASGTRHVAAQQRAVALPRLRRGRPGRPRCIDEVGVIYPQTMP